MHKSMYCVFKNYDREDGNNLTSNLFTLITPLTTHKNTSDIHVCSYKTYAQKGTTKKKNKKEKYFF